MSKIIVDFSTEVGKIKCMNAVNNGPVPYTELQTWSNFEDYKQAKIPFARTHDASFCSRYGGEHCVDTMFVFPDFDADVNDPNSYDFLLTDEYLKTMIDAGTEPFFRLGTKIEHWTKKYNTLPPKDFQKWAEICEHIVAHYTEGWANGYRWQIRYWEIWNEADGAKDNADPSKKTCWGGTQAEFFEMYRITATHLKKRFPQLKIGGPAVSNVEFGMLWGLHFVLKQWVKDFLEYMSKHKVPIDFFSWHTYDVDPAVFARATKTVRKALDKYGYTATENILNEWNYVESFRKEKFIESIKAIIGEKGAAFSMATMITEQNTSLDMLMYYDARPCVFCGLFDFYTMQPLKGYYPFVIFSKLVDMGTQVYSKCTEKGVYLLAAKGAKKGLCVVCYEPDGKREVRTVEVEAELVRPQAWIVDEWHNFDPCTDFSYKGKVLSVRMPMYSVLYVESEE